MKSLLQLLLASVFVIGCQSSSKPQMSSYDSFKREIEVKERVEKMMKETKERMDKKDAEIALANNYLEIVKCRIVEDDYGSSDIVVTVKNNTDKVIDGIKIKWTLTNNFGDIVEELNNGGISQDKLGPGKTESYRWNLFRTTATKATAYPISIHFTDGSRWELYK